MQNRRIHGLNLWSIALIMALVAMLVFVGCGGSGEEQTDGESGVTTVLVGTDGATQPYTYYDENNELTGYDIAVVKEVDKRLPDYEFKFEVTEFQSIFAGIDSGRYGMGANNISKNEERLEKYEFGNQYYLYNNAVIVTQPGRDDIKSLSDLGGKTTRLNPQGTFIQTFLEKYNEEHPDNPIDISYADQDMTKTFQDVIQGAIDFCLNEEIVTDSIVDEYGLDVQIVPLTHEESEQVMKPEGYFIFPKTDEGRALRDAVDGALVEMIKDGTISEISQEYLGRDYAEGMETID